MIRLVLSAWSYVVLSTIAVGESIERAYFLGSKERLFWAFENADKDPFELGDLTNVDPDIVRLVSVPYESPYLSKGDELWDVSAAFAEDSGKRRLFERAVFNETTGRFVFKGKREVMDRIDAIARAEIIGMPRSVQLSAKVYWVKKRNVGITKWKMSELEKQYQSLLETEVMTRPGQEVIFDHGELKITFTPQMGSSEEAVDMDFRVEGRFGGETFLSYSTATGFDGMSSVIELGAIGRKETLLLVLKPEIYLAGGVKFSEAVLDVENPSPSPAERLIPPSVEEKWPVDPETGKVFRVFTVPPTFMSFIDSGSGGGPEDDSFAEDVEEKDNDPHREYLLEKWDSRVRGGVKGMVYNMKPLLEQQGVFFGEGDFATLVMNSGNLYAELDSKNMELLYAIITAGTGPDYAPMITTHFTLVESAEKIGVGDLENRNLKESFRSGLVALPGRNATTEIKTESHSVSMLVEALGGSWDNVIDMRGEVKFLEGKEVLIEWKSGVTLLSGKREIVSSYKKDGKWYALVVEARVEEMVDWLLGSE